MILKDFCRVLLELNRCALEFRNKGIGPDLPDRAIEDGLDKGAIGIVTSTASSIARRLYERHHFKQFKGNWTMGEVFLELNR